MPLVYKHTNKLFDPNEPCGRDTSVRGSSYRGGFCCITKKLCRRLFSSSKTTVGPSQYDAFFQISRFEVLEAQRGEEALNLIRDVDNVDVVITDLRMPGMVDGLEVLRVQNEVSPGTKSILVTAYGSNQIKFQAAALGAVYLDKPIQLNDLLVHVPFQSQARIGRASTRRA